MNSKVLIAALLTWASLGVFGMAEEATDDRCYELRVYTAAPGKFDALHARFRDHTCKLFEKHGITNIGYWVPLDANDHRLFYILSFPSREEQKKSWAAFLADPDWIKAKTASEKDGKLVSKAESTFLHATDYTPPIVPKLSAEKQIFELRTYTTTPGNLDRLNARFRDHTVALFTKHGMEHFGYWLPDADQPTAGNTLIYILAHKSPEAHKASFDAFRTDPKWVAAREASEKDAGGSLTTPNGVKSILLQATDYSPTK